MHLVTSLLEMSKSVYCPDGCSLITIGLINKNGSCLSCIEDYTTTVISYAWMFPKIYTSSGERTPFRQWVLIISTEEFVYIKYSGMYNIVKSLVNSSSNKWKMYHHFFPPNDNQRPFKSGFAQTIKSD